MADTTERNFQSSKSQQELFDFARDPEKYPAHIDGLNKVEVLSSDDGHVEVNMDIEGQSSAVKMRFEWPDAPAAIKMEVLDGPNFNFIDYFRGVLNLSPTGGGCDAKLQLDYNIKIPMGAARLKEGAEKLADIVVGALEKA